MMRKTEAIGIGIMLIQWTERRMKETDSEDTVRQD